MKLPKYLILNKEVGETPLEVLDTFKAQNHTYAAVPMSYAGRLDPLASGKLLVLVGEECKRQKKYIGLDKEYEFEVLVDMSTDTGDVLGIASLGEHVSVPSKELIERTVTPLIGKRIRAYPPFSSKTVNGTPLFKYALEGRIGEIDLPTKEIEIFSLEHIDTQEVRSKKIFTTISEKIESIKPVTEHAKALGNDFRRPEIRKAYQALQNKAGNRTFYILKFRCVCSSGTYMRSLAEDIAAGLGTIGVAFSIHRTKMGSYKKIGPLGMWLKQY